VTAGGSVKDVVLTTMSSGDVKVNSVAASDDRITISSAGAIEENGTDAGADLTASVLDLNAATGIGSCGVIETAAAMIEAHSTDGHIDIGNASSLEVMVTTLTTGTGSITFSQSGGGSLTLVLARTTNGAISIELVMWI